MVMINGSVVKGDNVIFGMKLFRVKSIYKDVFNLRPLTLFEKFVLNLQCDRKLKPLFIRDILIADHSDGNLRGENSE